MPRRFLLRTCLNDLFASLCAVAIALALGAVWTVLTLHVRSAQWWFALPIGLIMGYTTRAWATPSRPLAMILAAAGTVLAAIYMQCLFTGLKLAAVMGLGYLHTLHKAGVVMLLALARVDWDTRLLAACIVGILLAILVAGRRSRHASVNRRQAS